MHVRVRPPVLFGAFIAVLVIAACAARIFWRAGDEAPAAAPAEAAVTAPERGAPARSSPSSSTGGGYAEKTASAPPAAGDAGEALPGGLVPVTAPVRRELSPELSRAMDDMHVRRMVDNYVQLLERGRAPSELEQALVAQGRLAKEALASAIEKRRLSADTMAKLRKTYDAIP
ncbi:MAG: hypothetical protein IT452_20800 [Planctomycetia bacterium]|nr:hypothetical protein [Planctomycetia bacterium]